MKTTGIAIKYGDFALGAKDNFTPGASERLDFIDLTQLQENNLVFPNYANPCELYQTVLNDSQLALPEDTDGNNYGFWSYQVSQDDGTFNTPISLEFTANGQYKSQGFTITFDNDNGIFSNNMNITWYRNGEIIESKDFNPDNAFYFCQQRVDNFDKVIMTFYSTNIPNNRLKIHVIDWGYGTYFYGDELKNVSMKQSIDPISSEIAINTCDFALISKRNINYSFQTKQPITIYFNGQLKGTHFVKTSTRTARTGWNVQTEDYIGMLETAMFEGNIYVDKNAGELLSEIFGIAKVPFEIEEGLASKTVTGHIPYCTCRKAVMQVAFAILGVVDTSNSEVVKVFALSDEISQTIPLSRIKQGQNFENSETVTHVQLAVHNYVQPRKGGETATLYEAKESGTGDNIFVRFDSPMYNLEIERGTIYSYTANYAIIKALSSCVLTGTKYADNITVLERMNDVVNVDEAEKKLSITEATLVSDTNSAEVLEHCYNWLTRVDSVNLDIIEGKHVTGGEYVLYGNSKYGAVKYGGNHPYTITYDMPVNVGDKVTCETEYLGNVTGRIIQQSFNMISNIIVKKAVLK